MGCFKILFFIILLNSCAAFNLVGFDCNNGPINHTIISLVHHPTCEDKQRNITQDNVELVVTQVMDKDSIEVIRCNIIAHHEVFYCGIISDSPQDSGIYTEIISVSRDECNELVKNQRYKVPYTGELFDVKESKQTISYTSFGKMNSGSCTSGGTLKAIGKEWPRAIRLTNLEIQYQISNGVVFFENDQIEVAPSFFCKYSRSACYNCDSGYSFWEVKTPECYEERPKAIVFQGYGLLIRDYTSREVVTYIQVSQHDYDFQILMKTSDTHICGLASHSTEHPGLFVTILHNNRLVGISKKVNPNDHLLTYLNSKLIYAMRHTKIQVEELYSLFEKKRCELKSDAIKGLLTLARIDPNDFAYQYTGQPGHAAVVRGEVVYLFKCSPVIVEPVEVGVTCYNELQVIYNNKTVFMSPRTRIITNVGRIIPCSPIMEPIYYYGDWYKQDIHGMSKVLPPIEIKDTPTYYEFKMIDGLTNKGIYSESLMANTRGSIVSNLEEPILQSRLVSGLNGYGNLPDNIRLTSLFSHKDYEVLDNKLSHWFDNIVKKLEYFGSISSAIFMLYIIYKVIEQVVVSFLNFRALRDSVGIWSASFCCCFSGFARHMVRGSIRVPQVFEFNQRGKPVNIVGGFNVNTV